MNLNGVKGEVTLHHKGSDLEVEWKMDFFSLSEATGAWYWSPDFSFQGNSWYLVIWPNGSTFRNSSGFIDLRLCRQSCNGPPVKVALSFALKSVNGKKALKKQRTGDFDECIFHHIDRLISKSSFEKRQAEFLAEGFLTVLCTLKEIISTGSTSGTTSANCSFCNRNMGTENISTHEKKCMDRPIKCPDCFDALLVKDWLNSHDCQKNRTEDCVAVTECSYCKNDVETEKLSFHEKKCMDRPIKCPECSEVVLLQKWHDHDCQDAGGESSTSVVSPKCKTLNDLKQLFLNQDNCDVLLRVKGREFSAHKAILTARSPVFASIFRNDMKEKKTGIVEIEDCDPSSFSNFLCFLYCEEMEIFSEENVFSLFSAADKYDVTDLRTKCLKFIKENVSVNTFCETITVALQHTEKELIHLGADFFIDNAEEIVETVKWQSFAAENPTESNELFIKYIKSVKHSKQ